MSSWIDLASEVVVVDSQSQDGTLEILQRGLKHPRVRFLSHPPGLYASWNAGVRACTTEFTYISTVGETITLPGLQELLAVARRFDADVVLSKPAFRKLNGETIPAAWPIDDILESLQITEPRRLHRLEAMLFACVHTAGALTGSCASDLFRTRSLQRFPFPTEFGTSGDGIWGVRHAAELGWVVVPGCFSTFLLHATTKSQAENPARPGTQRLDVVLRNAMEIWRQQHLVSDEELARIGWGELASALTDYLDAKAALDRYRSAPFPWLLRPRAWRARMQRESHWVRLRACQNSALTALSAEAGGRSTAPAAGDGRYGRDRRCAPA